VSKQAAAQSGGMLPARQPLPKSRGQPYDHDHGNRRRNEPRHVTNVPTDEHVENALPRLAE
jgi:hypothetical protein